MRISSDFVPLVQGLHECPNLRLLTLSGDLVPGYTHKGMKVAQSVTEVTLGCDHVVREETSQWMEEVVVALKKVCCVCGSLAALYSSYECMNGGL